METLDPSWLPAGLVTASQPKSKGKKKKKKDSGGGGGGKSEADAAFPRLRSCCSLCGAEPDGEEAFKSCGKCGVTRYCGVACQREAWKQPCAHKSSCGCELPTSNAIASGTLTEVATILHEFRRADASLAEACAHKLASALAATLGSRKHGYEAGAAAALAVAMAAHATEVGVQRESCAALGHAAMGDPRYKQAVVDCGGAEAIVAAMRGHAGSVDVQRLGCFAIRNVALGVSSVQQRMVAAGGSAAVVEALRTHASDGALAFEALAALANMCGGDAGCHA